MALLQALNPDHCELELSMCPAPAAVWERKVAGAQHRQN